MLNKYLSHAKIGLHTRQKPKKILFVGGVHKETLSFHVKIKEAGDRKESVRETGRDGSGQEGSVDKVRVW